MTIKKRIVEQLWFRATLGLMSTVALGLLLNWLGPPLTAVPVLGQVVIQLCKIVEADCGGTAQQTAREPGLPVPRAEEFLGDSVPPPPPPPPIVRPDRSADFAQTPGSSLATATDLEELDEEARSLAERLDTPGQPYFYQFSLSNVAELQLLLDGRVAHAVLLDATGNPLARSKRTPAGEALTRSLKAGNYFIWLQAEKSGEFALRLAAVPIPSHSEDDTLSTARSLNTLDEQQRYSDWVGLADGQDFYRFEIQEPVRLDLLLEGPAASLQLLESNGERLARSRRTGVGEVIERSIDPGVYYVLVQPLRNREGPYNLVLTPHTP